MDLNIYKMGLINGTNKKTTKSPVFFYIFYVLVLPVI